MEHESAHANASPLMLLSAMSNWANHINMAPLSRSDRPQATPAFPLHVSPKCQPVAVHQHSEHSFVLQASNEAQGVVLMLIGTNSLGNGLWKVGASCRDEIIVVPTAIRDLLVASFGPESSLPQVDAAAGMPAVADQSATLPVPVLERTQAASVTPLSDEEVLDIAMEIAPDPFLFGPPMNEDKHVEDGLPQFTQEEKARWIADLRGELLDQDRFKRVLQIFSPPQPDDPSMPIPPLTREEWQTRAMVRLANPKDLLKHLAAWIQRCHFLDDQANALHRKAGAPVLDCNKWLEEQLALLPDPNDHGHLFEPWLRLRMENGQLPRDPLRDFQKAVDRALKRLAEKKGRSRSGAGARYSGPPKDEPGNPLAGPPLS